MTVTAVTVDSWNSDQAAVAQVVLVTVAMPVESDWYPHRPAVRLTVKAAMAAAF